MIIYKITQLSTGKFYIGSLKNTKKWATYKTSSKSVKQLMSENPNDFTKEILLTFSTAINYSDVVTLEQKIIEFYFTNIGKDKLLNKGYYKQQAGLYGRGLPKSVFTKGQKPWNYGKKGLQISFRKGKTFHEIYGDKADKILEQRQQSRGNKGYRKAGEYVCSEPTKAKIREKRKLQQNVSNQYIKRKLSNAEN